MYFLRRRNSTWIGFTHTANLNGSCAFPILQMPPVSYRGVGNDNVLIFYDHTEAILCELRVQNYIKLLKRQSDESRFCHTCLCGKKCVEAANKREISVHRHKNHNKKTKRQRSIAGTWTLTFLTFCNFWSTCFGKYITCFSKWKYRKINWK